MKEFQLFRYLKKWMPLIILFFVAMTVLSYGLLSANQKYVATAVIRYSNAEATDGLTPDGSKIDTSEINSASNMAKAMENLGLSQDTYSVDQFCSSIEVTPILKEEDVAVQTALNEQGEKSIEQPTIYAVTCTMDSDVLGVDSDFVRNVLNELLDVYFSDYSEEHINRNYIGDEVRGIQLDNYDYLEVTDQISDLLGNTIQKMNDYNDRAMGFRSAATGYSFKNLRDDFQMLKNVDVYRIYSLILGNRLSKDTYLLANKYTDKRAEQDLASAEAIEDLDEANRVIDTYVEKMRSSGNTYDDYPMDFNYILDEVYDNYQYDKHGSSSTQSEGEEDTSKWVKVDHTVEYDTLLENWDRAKNKVDHAAVDKDFYQFILSAYGYAEPLTQETQAEGASGPAVSYTVVSSPATNEEIEAELTSLMKRMNELFDIADATNAEYNEYLGAQNIQTLSSVTAGTKFNLKLYMIILVIVFLILGCGAAVLFGRMGDILEYLFLRDRLTGCMNRVACDNFISNKAKEAVHSGFCCVNLQLRNQREINRDMGREEADKILQAFGRVLKDLFGGRNGSFVGYNGSGQFWAFFDIDVPEESIAPEVERLATVLNDQVSSYPVMYSLGGVNANELNSYNIRTLITQAVAQRKDYTTASRQSADNEETL